MQIVNLDSWAHFEAELGALLGGKLDRAFDGHRTVERLLFRGMGSDLWTLDATLERAYPMELNTEQVSLGRYYRAAFAAKPMIETMTDRIWSQLPQPPEFQAMLNDERRVLRGLDWLLSSSPVVYEYLAYLRHHGFPSPLLDWTSSPYVAAFFAFDGSPSRGPEGDNTDPGVAIYALAQRPFRVRGLREIVLLGPHVRAHPRHVLQQSQYSICVESQEVGDEGDFRFLRHRELLEDEDDGDGWVCIKYVLPLGERTTALRRLDLMNVNAHSLFGSEDSLVRTVARRELLFKDLGR